MNLMISLIILVMSTPMLMRFFISAMIFPSSVPLVLVLLLVLVLISIVVVRFVKNFKKILIILAMILVIILGLPKRHLLRESPNNLYIVHNGKDTNEIYYVMGKQIPDVINIKLDKNNIGIPNNQYIEINIKFQQLEPLIDSRIQKRKLRYLAKKLRYLTIVDAKIINEDGTVAKVVYENEQKIHILYTNNQIEHQLNAITDIINYILRAYNNVSSNQITFNEIIEIVYMMVVESQQIYRA